MLNSMTRGKLELLPTLLALACADAATSFEAELELGTLEAPVLRSSEGDAVSGTASRFELASSAVVAADLGALEGNVVISEYKLPASLDAVVNPNLPTELWAAVYRPALLEPGRRYPLVLFMHGNHGTCGRGEAPRRDDNIQYSVLGTCPPDYVVVPNHRGYDYLGRDLAARNYIVVSINTNRGINGVAAPDPAGDESVIGARARLLLRHLELLSHWDAGSEPTPAAVGVDLTGRIDFSEVGLLGHSRGGQAVRLAYREYRRSRSPWPALIESPVSFRGIFEIAPTDEPIDGTFINAPDAPWTVLLPACDWDLRELPGVRPFDRMLSFQLSEEAAAAPFFKAFYHVWGANHNFYNSEWQVADAGAGGTVPGCLNHTPIFDPAVFGSPLQRETARFAAAAFFTANVGVDRDESGNAVFDSAIALPVSYPVNRGYHPGGRIALGDAADDTAYSLVLEDFVGAAGTSSYGLPNETGGALTVRHTQLPVHASSAVALIEDVVASPSTFFQSNWAPVGAGFDLSGYDYLDLRVDRSTTAVSSVSATFLIELVNADDGRSAPVSLAEFLDLLPPPRGFTGRTLQTVRIPLGAFDGATLDAVRAVRFTFTTPFEAGILLANIRATRATTLAPTQPALTARAVSRGTIPALATAPARTRPSSPFGATTPVFESDVIVTGNSIARVVRGAAQVEVTLQSTQPFELRPKNLVLSIGGLTSRQASYPTGDLHTVQFLIAREAFERLGAREAVRVDYGSSSPVVWQFGLLDTALAAD